jgi:hypothetical protein
VLVEHTRRHFRQAKRVTENDGFRDPPPRHRRTTDETRADHTVIDDLEQITNDASASFGGLDASQLNWKPAADSWSVAQCLDHLITINSLYFPIFEKMGSGRVVNTFLEKYSPLSGFFGRFLIKAMMPENPKKMKTSKKAYPSSSEIDGNIVERFAEHISPATRGTSKGSRLMSI